MNLYKLSNIDAFKHYGWEKSTNCNLFASSICADGVINENEKNIFGNSINKSIINLLNCNEFSEYKLYAIFNRALYAKPTRTDNYKKVLKSNNLKPYINSIQIADEIATEYNNFYLYSGIAYIQNINEIDFFSIFDEQPFINMMFLSKNSLHEISCEFKNIINDMFGESVKTPKINYCKLCERYCKDDYIILKYFTSFVDMEIGIIYCDNVFTHGIDFGR